MAAIYSKTFLNNSINGRQIPITGTGSASPTLIHTALPSGSIDEIWLYAYNNATASLTCNVLWGGTSSIDTTQFTIPSQDGRTLMVDGKILQNGLSVWAYTSVSGSLIVDGFVNRITPTDVDSLVTDWVTRVVANGGTTPSSNTQTALTTFVNALGNANILSNMIGVNCFVPDNFTASITPLIRPASSLQGLDPWTNANFTGSDLSVNGLKGDGTTRYLNTGINATSNFPDSFGGLTVYSVDSGNSNIVQAAEIGALNTLNSNFNFCLLLNYDGTSIGELGGYGAMSTIYPNTGSGYYSINRFSTTDAKLFRGNSTTGHQYVQGAVGTGNTPLSSVMYVFATRNLTGGVPVLWSPRTISFAAIHTQLTETESRLFYNAIQTLRQSLGGGYV